MLYLKCVGIFFLIHSIMVAIKWFREINEAKITDAEKVLLYLIGWLTGGLWVFLLLKIINTII